MAESSTVLAIKADELDDGLDLIAIPTTAGSGSERTPFAVAYVDSVKRSIEHESIRPRLAIVDPVLTYSMSREVTVSSGFDALSHALESLWSVRATPESIELSRKALLSGMEHAFQRSDGADAHQSGGRWPRRAPWPALRSLPPEPPPRTPSPITSRFTSGFLTVWRWR